MADALVQIDRVSLTGGMKGGPRPSAKGSAAYPNLSLFSRRKNTRSFRLLMNSDVPSIQFRNEKRLIHFDASEQTHPCGWAGH